MMSKRPRYGWLTPPSSTLEDRKDALEIMLNECGLPLLMPDRQISARKYRHMLFDRDGNLAMSTYDLEACVEWLEGNDEPEVVIYWPDSGKWYIVHFADDAEIT